MKPHRFLLYPAGAPGTGLLILRCSVVLFLLSSPVGRFPTLSIVTAGMGTLALLIGLGLWMRPVASIVIGMTSIAYLTQQAPVTALVAHALDAIVLAICGPGAFSLDARLFGRATVHLLS